MRLMEYRMLYHPNELNHGIHITVQPILQGTLMRGHPHTRGHFLITTPYLHHVKEPVMKGHLSCRDTFSWILECPLKTGFTVLVCMASVLYPIRFVIIHMKSEDICEYTTQYYLTHKTPDPCYLILFSPRPRWPVDALHHLDPPSSHLPSRRKWLNYSPNYRTNQPKPPLLLHIDPTLALHSQPRQYCLYFLRNCLAN